MQKKSNKLKLQYPPTQIVSQPHHILILPFDRQNILSIKSADRLKSFPVCAFILFNLFLFWFWLWFFEVQKINIEYFFSILFFIIMLIDFCANIKLKLYLGERADLICILSSFFGEQGWRWRKYLLCFVTFQYLWTSISIKNSRNCKRRSLIRPSDKIWIKFFVNFEFKAPVMLWNSIDLTVIPRLLDLTVESEYI